MLTTVYRALLFSLLLLKTSVFAQSVVPWSIPDGTKPNFTDVYNNGNSITWSWQALNHSMSDLWLTSFDPTLSYAVRIASNINITEPGTLPWTITVNETLIDIDNRFVLRFTLTGTDIYPLYPNQFPSPAFIILKRGATLAPASLSSVVATATQFSESTTATTAAASITSLIAPASSVPSGLTESSPSSDSSSSGGSGLSTGAKVGIGIGVTALVVVILGLCFAVLRLYRRVKATSNRHSQGIIPDYPDKETTTSGASTPVIREISGLHEATGDRRHPAELGSKRESKVVFEMPG
ncbi:uncharacterized protein PV06_05906 [Exophiala oligosperma]|uniref:Mid2 domain-containing protein n=2 Tax=Chaetothyriales TaxID=34395 RepID=A0A0D2DIR1_9EURO|nr:uncharacterized protein PV06_05906 [Exophiala oligosperma]KAJ9627566.1 hypothetical protein H2204_009605 [Knufia peltigerae]KIW42345.1 hypothetical protein PV06_05906 [Exophiala oligosperma]